MGMLKNWQGSLEPKFSTEEKRKQKIDNLPT